MLDENDETKSGLGIVDEFDSGLGSAEAQLAKLNDDIDWEHNNHRNAMLPD